MRQNNADAMRQHRAEVLERTASEFAVMWESEEEVRRYGIRVLVERTKPEVQRSKPNQSVAATRNKGSITRAHTVTRRHSPHAEVSKPM